MIDINVEESKSVLEKIIINSKTVNVQNQFSTIKCYQSLPTITTLETRGVNLIKIHKTIYLNLPNLVHIDLRDNKLIKISKNFKLFKNLISLKLDNNSITFIPSFLTEFSKLEVLTISNNNLTSIPASIQYLTSLKIFKFSNNKITKLPIEFGQLKSLECLHLDGNYYTEIPTTLCYLKHLNEISFEWLEFLEPPFYKTLKEAMGKTCIGIIRNSLQEMIKSSILYCDFNTFVERISSNKKKDNANKINPKNTSTSNNNTNTNTDNKENLATLPNKSSIIFNHPTNNSSNNNNPVNASTKNSKYLKIFTAIENNYYGVIKALLETSPEFFKIKNIENKTPFYISINNRNEDLISLFLSKIDLSNFPLSHVYFHKAIRMRNPELVKKLVAMGVNINAVDDQGSSCFHILFSAFTKQLSRCALIADFLLEKGANVNNYNNDNWAPIHIAARRGSKECLLWILSSNKILRREHKEEFDLNLKGKNRWTPLHLTVNSYRLEETLILLENGCDVFARNMDSRTPKRVSNGNYLFTKLLTKYETIILSKKYKDSGEKKNTCGRCYTTVDGDEEDCESPKKGNENFPRCKTNAVFMVNGFNGQNTSPSCMVKGIVKAQTLKKEPIQNDPSNKGTLNKKEKTKEIKNQCCVTNNNILGIVNSYRSILPKSNTSSNFLNMKKINTVKTLFSSNNINKQLENLRNSQMLEPNNPDNSINNIDYSELSNITKEAVSNDGDNVDYFKEILLNSDSSLYEKMDALMKMKISKQDIFFLTKIIIENLELENEMNLIILSDICTYALDNAFVDLIPILSQLAQNNVLEKKKKYIIKELENTIHILEVFKKNSFNKSEFFKKPPHVSQIKDTKIINNPEEENEMFLHKNGVNEEEDDNDEFNIDEMNELIDNENRQKGKSSLNINSNLNYPILSNIRSLEIDGSIPYLNQESAPNL